MKFRWEYLEGLGVLLALYNGRNLPSSFGFAMVVAGAVLVVVGEIGRRRKPAPQPTMA
jgi:hypothetical protein